MAKLKLNYLKIFVYKNILLILVVKFMLYFAWKFLAIFYIKSY